MPTRRASERASRRAPTPAAAPTRMCCRCPSLRIASGSPFAVLNSSTNPQYVPGCMQYFFSDQLPSAFFGQVMMSDLSRTAYTPSVAPSIEPNR